jgi:VWFA-related protein
MFARLLIATMSASVLLQSQSPIRSGVDLLRLHVTALDDKGQPVRDLRPEDFVVSIDGKPRAVSFAKFYGPPDERPAAELPAAGFATNTMADPGRVVVFVVDVESMHPGYEKLILDTAGAMVDRLSSSDAVGLLVLPGKGVELTRDHARIRQALGQLRGFASVRTSQRYFVAVSEAEAFERRDTRVKREVIERECPANAASRDPGCPQEVEQEARMLLTEADRRIRTVVSALTALNTQLRSIDAPKTLVVLSAGMPFRVHTMGQFRDLERETIAAGTTTYVVQLDQPNTEAAGPTSSAGSIVRHDLREGLSTIAQVTDGTLSAGVGRARSVFERIRTDVVHSYQLGVESVPADADGKTHRVAVKVLRDGITIRARREVVVPLEARPALTPVEVLSQAVGRAETPLAAAAYATRGDDPETLKVIVLIELLSPVPASPLPSYAFSVMNGDTEAFKTADQMIAVPGGVRAVFAAQLAPGDYRLRVAAVDGASRPGSVEMPLQVGLRKAGLLELSDLLVGTASDKFTPATHVSTGDAVAAFLEMYAVDPAHFEGATVDLEMKRAGEDAVVARTSAEIHLTDAPGRRIAEAHLPVEMLGPGTYVVSAVVGAASGGAATVSSTLVLRPAMDGGSKP